MCDSRINAAEVFAYDGSLARPPTPYIGFVTLQDRHGSRVSHVRGPPISILLNEDMREGWLAF